MGNTQEKNSDSYSYFENEYQEQLPNFENIKPIEESNLNSPFEDAYNNQFGKFVNVEGDSITSYENLNLKCNKETELDIKDNKEKESEQNYERNDFVESKGKSFIDTNKDKISKKSENYQKEKTEGTRGTAGSTEKTESSAQLNKDKSKETEIKKDINENNKENIELIILDRQIKNINIEENKEIEIKIDNNDTNNINTPNILKENNEDKNLNKKRNRDKNINIKKISFDKIMRRIKTGVLNAIIRFINQKIEIDYNYDIGKGVCIKQLLSINKKEYSHPKVDENKKFLFKNLEEILATNISEKYTNYIPTHNIELVQNLINKGEDYKKIFELTFLDCMEHIRGTKNIDILNGLDKIDDILKLEKDIDENDKENFRYCMMNYKDIIEGKKGRNSKKTKNE